MGGRIFSFPKDAAVNQADLVVDLKAALPRDLAGRNVSLFDAEFHPRFADNHYLFVCYVHPGDGGHTRVSRLTLDGDSPPRAVPGSEQVIITWPAGGHNARLPGVRHRWLFVYCHRRWRGPQSTRRFDDRPGCDRPARARSCESTSITPRGEPAYTVPADNPFVNTAERAARKFGPMGCAIPGSSASIRQSGNVFAADNGWETWEMVHRIVRGGNCGWPVMEGRAALRSEVKPGPTPIIPPVDGSSAYRSEFGHRRPSLSRQQAARSRSARSSTATISPARSGPFVPDKDNSYSPTTLVDTDQRIVAFTARQPGRTVRARLRLHRHDLRTAAVRFERHLGQLSRDA